MGSNASRPKASPVSIKKKTEKARLEHNKYILWYNNLKKLFPKRSFKYEKLKRHVFKRTILVNGKTRTDKFNSVYFDGGHYVPKYRNWPEYRRGDRIGTSIRLGRISLERGIREYKGLYARKGAKRRGIFLEHIRLGAFWEGLTTRSFDILAPITWTGVRKSNRELKSKEMLKSIIDWHGTDKF